MIAHANVDVAMLAKPVGCLVARPSGSRDVDQYLQAIQVVRRLRAQQFIFENLQVWDQLDLGADGTCHIQCSPE